MMELSIIILTFNTKELTLACLSSLVAHYKEQLSNGKCEIILVDNASRDATVKAVTDAYYDIPHIRIIENKENVGFSKGNNIGAKHAKGKYLLFLNSDTSVKHETFFMMTDFLNQHPSVGVMGGKLKDTQGVDEYTARAFYHLSDVAWMLVAGERFVHVKSLPQKVTEVDWVSGGFMMTSCDLFEKLGGFDEQLFMYTEDMEYCYRAKEAGYQTYYFPDAVATHIGQGSSNRSFAVVHIYQGLLYFYKKHKAAWQFRMVQLLLIAKAYIAITIGVITNNTYLKNTYRESLRINL